MKDFAVILVLLGFMFVVSFLGHRGRRSEMFSHGGSGFDGGGGYGDEGPGRYGDDGWSNEIKCLGLKRSLDSGFKEYNANCYKGGGME